MKTMNYFKAIIFFLLSSIISINYANSQNRKIIIDTDCGFDDLSAISLFFLMPEIEIQGIVSCGGNIDNLEGYQKLNCFINTMNDSTENQFDINKIYLGKDSERKNIPEWRNHVEKIVWGYSNSQEINKENNINNLLDNILKTEDESIYYICLGPFTNLYNLLNNNSEIKNKIKKVFWYNGSIDEYGFNYEYDKEAADFVFSNDFLIDIVSNLGNEHAVYDENLKKEISLINSFYTNLLCKNLFSETYHYQTLWDELVPIYFLYPELFSMLPNKDNPKISINTDLEIFEIKRRIIDLFSSNLINEKNVVFDIFPKDKSNFKYDLSIISDSIIELYGNEEWKACILTNEFHQHLGIYSIVGAKMGIAAMEYFNCQKNYLSIISYAGNKPPISCLNDGLQMSTGATLGYGMITISETENKIPEADFIYENQKIHIKLKAEYSEQIKKDIEDGILIYGNLTDGYWKLIRKLGLKYWKEWDRNQIFEIEEIK